MGRLRVALEEENTEASAPPLNNTSTTSTQVEASTPSSTSISARPLDTAGPLYDGKRGFCRVRWQFWKSRFSKLKGEVGEVAKMVEQALDAMEKAEKVMRKRDLDLDTGETARLFKSPRT
ncbi:hypothetical protein V8E54_000655 [Elaphomyces granulatus]